MRVGYLDLSEASQMVRTVDSRCYHRQHRPAIGLEDGCEVDFVDGIEDGDVD